MVGIIEQGDLLVAMASTLVAMASNLIAMASNLLAIYHHRRLTNGSLIASSSDSRPGLSGHKVQTHANFLRS